MTRLLTLCLLATLGVLSCGKEFPELPVTLLNSDEPLFDIDRVERVVSDNVRALYRVYYTHRYSELLPEQQRRIGRIAVSRNGELGGTGLTTPFFEDNLPVTQRSVCYTFYFEDEMDNRTRGTEVCVELP